ncbi:hypothetical protein [Kordia sp.]|uniref:hypothetical protein n=1 Tax=Kordia sp. TaxID=1965332 RepID=UPI0025C05106|nr:hypothetical protein [Kordia sp.]MCH2195122.1 hypothetical protein [Kordia sp.]
MRIFKIILIIVSVFISGTVIYLVWNSMATSRSAQIPLYIYLYLGFAFASAIANIIYHIKTFRFYRRKEKRRLEKKVHKFLWVGTICFSTFLIYIGGVTLYSLLRFIEYGYSKQDVFSVLLFLIPGFFGFLEASLLKKRIRRLRSEHDVIEEIDNIGKEMEY